MWEFLLAILAGVVTIGGPCILPLLPIILGTGSTSRHPLRPAAIVLGFTVSFTALALLFAYFGSFLGLSPDEWRVGSAAAIIIFGLIMLFPKAQARLLGFLEPRVAGLQPKGYLLRNDLASGLVVGFTLGAVWTPCAGPVLGSILTLVAAKQHLAQAGSLLFAYALGAGLPMLLIAYGGQAAVRRVRFFTAYAALIQKIFGVLIILAGLAILTRADLAFQLYLAERYPGVFGGQAAVSSTGMPSTNLPVLAPARPSFTGITQWWNTPGNQPLAEADLQGKVVLVDFWTYSCINCIRTQPVLKAWWKAYASAGLVIVGVHTPEFAFEKVPANVAAAIQRAGLAYPVALDADYGTWNAYGNQYWPAEYLFDRQGRLRYTHFGEGNYDESEAAIRALLAEGGQAVAAPTKMDTTPAPILLETGETYFGYARQSNFANVGELAREATADYQLQAVTLHQWSVGGHWNIGAEKAVTAAPGDVFRMRVRANAMHLVLGAAKATALAVTVDGQPPTDTQLSPDTRRQADGTVTMTVLGQRLYTAALLPDGGEHVVEVRIPDAGVEFYTATFGE